MVKEKVILQIDSVQIFKYGTQLEDDYNLFLEWLDEYYDLVFIPHPHMIIYVNYGYEEGIASDHSFYAIIFSGNKKIIVEYDFIDCTLTADGKTIPVKIPPWTKKL